MLGILRVWGVGALFTIALSACGTREEGFRPGYLPICERAAGAFLDCDSAADSVGISGLLGADTLRIQRICSRLLGCGILGEKRQAKGEGLDYRWCVSRFAQQEGLSRNPCGQTQTQVALAFIERCVLDTPCAALGAPLGAKVAEDLDARAVDRRRCKHSTEGSRDFYMATVCDTALLAY